MTTPAKPKALTTEGRKAWEGICGRQAVAHSPDGKLYADAPDRRVRLRDTATGKVLHELEDDGLAANFGVFSADGSRLALRRLPIKDGRTGPEVLQLYDSKTGKKTGDIEPKNGFEWVTHGYSPDGGTLAWVDNTHDVHLHDAATGKLVRTLHTDAPPRDECVDADVLFTPDGERVIVTGYTHREVKGTLDYDFTTLPTRVFRASDGKELNHFDTNTDLVRAMLVYHRGPSVTDGTRLAVTDNGTVRLFDLASGKELVQLAGHPHGVHSLAFAPDGKVLATGGADGVVYLWAVANLGAEKKDR